MSTYWIRLKGKETIIGADVERLRRHELEPELVEDLVDIITSNNQADGQFLIFDEPFAQYIEEKRAEGREEYDELFSEFKNLEKSAMLNSRTYQDPGEAERVLGMIYSLRCFFSGVEAERIKKLAFSFDSKSDPSVIAVDIHPDADISKFSKATLNCWIGYLMAHFDHQRSVQTGVFKKLHKPSGHLRKIGYNEETKTFDYNPGFKGEYYELSQLACRALPRLKTPEEILVMTDVIEKVREKFAVVYEAIMPETEKCELNSWGRKNRI